MESTSQAPPPRVVAWTRSARFDALLARLGIERRPMSCADEGSFVLVEGDMGLELRPPGEWDRAGIAALFPPDRRPTPPGSARHPLVKAFGKKIGTIYDATAGLGGDAYRLAAAGYRVRACERNPVVYSLIASAWDHARAEGRVSEAIADRLSFEWAEAGALIESIEARDLGVYLDPMYPPPRRSSALPKRALQVLRSLIGEEGDTRGLLSLARQHAARVVVKRPHHASPLMDDVGFAVETKLVRFDVYVNPERMGRPS